jgi:hypothetical protein
MNTPLKLLFVVTTRWCHLLIGNSNRLANGRLNVDNSNSHHSMVTPID